MEQAGQTWDQTAPQGSPVTGKNEAGELIFRLSDQQLKLVREIVAARELEQLSHDPGWERLCNIAAMRIEQIEAQFLNPKVFYEREASWVMRERLVAVKTFWASLLEGIEIAKQTLASPEEIKLALEQTAINPADLAGDFEE